MAKLNFGTLSRGIKSALWCQSLMEKRFRALNFSQGLWISVLARRKEKWYSMTWGIQFLWIRLLTIIDFQSSKLNITLRVVKFWQQIKRLLRYGTKMMHLSSPTLNLKMRLTILKFQRMVLESFSPLKSKRRLAHISCLLLAQLPSGAHSLSSLQKSLKNQRAPPFTKIISSSLYLT
jgi:hypothetical protein